MAKTKEELGELKEEYESLMTRLKSLSEDELDEVTGGFEFALFPIIFSQKGLFPSPKIDNLGLLNEKPEGNVKFQEVKMEGNISNRSDNNDSGK